LASFSGLPLDFSDFTIFKIFSNFEFFEFQSMGFGQSSQWLADAILLEHLQQPS
jgi:hypothetical protein